MAWVSLDFWLGLGVGLVLFAFFVAAKFGKGRFRKRRVKVDDKWVHLITIDGGKKWFQVYWDSEGVGYIMATPDPEVTKALAKTLAREQSRHEALAARRDYL